MHNKVGLQCHADLPYLMAGLLYNADTALQLHVGIDPSTPDEIVPHALYEFLFPRRDVFVLMLQQYFPIVPRGRPKYHAFLLTQRALYSSCDS